MERERISHEHDGARSAAKRGFRQLEGTPDPISLTTFLVWFHRFCHFRCMLHDITNMRLTTRHYMSEKGR
jgi:hypothetical protein